MITEAFDNQSAAIINPPVNENAPQVDACILTFSHVIEEFVLAITTAGCLNKKIAHGNIILLSCAIFLFINVDICYYVHFKLICYVSLY